ncbi:HNH endonuclease [Vagococcus lutrae]|uniref:HNH endonuclease n=1 Tax=Vagococcus lutrae TaxID=81947 RepID=UPI0028901DC6|nr:HNH endonuclease [Vagococcus lutrae]MDT2805260.1 HNH endonuclease [Vagococcus lutrae]
MASRSISNRKRFEVLTRDFYTCQYCGIFAGEMEMELDHIVPISKGGTNEKDNLLTACVICNNGKSDRVLPLETRRLLQIGIAEREKMLVDSLFYEN